MGTECCCNLLLLLLCLLLLFLLFVVVVVFLLFFVDDVFCFLLFFGFFGFFFGGRGVVWLVGWLVGCLVVWLFGCFAVLLFCCFAVLLFCCFAVCCRLFAAGCLLLAAGCWLLAAGCWLLLLLLVVVVILLLLYCCCYVVVVMLLLLCCCYVVVMLVCIGQPMLIAGDLNADPPIISCLAKGISAGRYVDLALAYSLGAGLIPDATFKFSREEGSGSRRDFFVGCPNALAASQACYVTDRWFTPHFSLLARFRIGVWVADVACPVVCQPICPACWPEYS